MVINNIEGKSSTRLQNINNNSVTVKWTDHYHQPYSTPKTEKKLSCEFVQRTFLTCRLINFIEKYGGYFYLLKKKKKGKERIDIMEIKGRDIQNNGDSDTHL